MAKPNNDRKGAVRSLIAPLTPKQARKEIGANTQLQFGDQLRDYGKQIGASKQQSRQINQWYGQYRNNVRDIQRGQAGATAALQNQARAWDNTAAIRAKAEDGRVTGEEDRSAAIRGALPDTSGQAQTDQYAEEQRNALRKSYGMRAAEMGTASNNLLGQFREASFSGLRDDQRRERNIRLNIQKDRNATKKDMGAFKVSERGRLRGEEREWNLQNRTLASDNRNAAAGRALDWATENRIAREGRQGASSGRASDRAEKREDRREARQERGQAIQEGMAAIRLTIANAADSKRTTEKLSNPNYLYNWLVEKKGVEPKIARAVARRWLIRSGNIADSLF